MPQIEDYYNTPTHNHPTAKKDDRDMHNIMVKQLQQRGNQLSKTRYKSEVTTYLREIVNFLGALSDE
jgi:uncharacterized protein YaaR (DUF327 family)